jgi:transcriptional regulator with XRE-family HTH domain
MSRYRSPEKVRIAAAIHRGLRKRGLTNRRLAELIGVSETMVGFWTQGRYAPAIGKAERMAEVLDEPMILHLTKLATVGTCRVCLAPFFRRNDARGQITRRAYCSQRCLRDYHKGVRAQDRHPAELAVAEFCRGCEPEGFCRTEDCALRAFSPLPLVLPRVTAA